MKRKLRQRTSPVWICSRDEMQKLLDSSSSKSDVLRKLQLNPHTGNHRTLNIRIKQDGLSLDLMNQNLNEFRQNFIQTLAKKYGYTLQELLIENSPNLDRKSLKKKLISSGMLTKECSICKCIDWLNKPLSLQLDHVNGVNNDNRIENLRLLCPNCHSQTDTFAGKRLKKSKISIEKTKCISCDKLLLKSKICGRCVAINEQRKFEITKEELEKLVLTHPFTEIAKMFGVCDHSIRKRCKLLNVKIPTFPRGHWIKKSRV